MKRLVSFIILSFFAEESFAQYGNEWISFHQEYYKIPVAREGLYRVTYDDLQAAGFPVSADPRSFQIFHRGIEQAILVNGEGDGIFDPTDYFEFYGTANDGTLDSTLYEVSDDQPHRMYNLYSDTTSYFLTFGGPYGKRISTFTDLPSGGGVRTTHLAERLLILKQSYAAGADYGNIRKTLFDAGEGWTGVQILHNQEVAYTIEGVTESDQASGKPYLEVLLTGRGPMSHNVALSTGARPLATVDFQGFDSYTYAGEIDWTDIDTDGKLSVKVRVTGTGGADRVSVGYIRLTFPRLNDFSGAAETLLYLPEDTPGPSALRVDNATADIRFFDITDPTSVQRLSATLGALGLDVAVPGGSKRKIFATAAALTPASIRRVAFREIHPAAHNYIIITHPVLRRAAGGYTDPVKAYAEYRALPVGGAFDTLIINIDQLYDQFNYGEPSPRAIYQFMKFLASTKLPDYLFLVGKGLDVNYAYRRNPSAFSQYRDLVPSAGYPASDMAFSAGLSGTPHTAGVATGRLTANTPEEVAAYLNKVVEKEALPFDKLWRKKILHLSGGIEENEPALFREIMRGFQPAAEDVFLGGRVQAVAKQSTEVKLVNIAEEVNAGVALITFFGHSAPNTLDFDIGWVSDPVMGYNNTGKYPLLLMNGCDAGSFFLNTTIFGENWIKTPDKGAVGFIAHSSYGLVSGLQRYTSLFYEVAFSDSAFIRKGVGKVQQEVARRYLAQYGNTSLALTQTQQMVLLGDPAVKIFGAVKPDFAVDETRIHVSGFNEEPLTALADSFRIDFPVHNLGIAEEEQIRVLIRRQYGDTVIEYDSLYSSVLYSDTLSMVIRNPDANGSGLNFFTISIDAGNQVDELSETNNNATFEYFIPLNGTRNLYPYNYSIVSSREIDLSFQYTDMLAADRDYVIEIDTLPTFDSGFRQQFQRSAPAWVRQSVVLLENDSLVYYWRTKLAQPLENESRDWTVSSFSYIKDGPEGWAQIHFPQFGKNAFEGLTPDPVLKRMEFTETISDISVRTFSAASGTPLDSISLRVNGVEFNVLNEGAACRTNTINLVAFDRRSTQPYAGLYFKWYEAGRRSLCGREPYVINSFTPSELVTGNQNDLIQYVDNIHPGDSVILFSMGDAGYSQWPEEARAKLQEFGIATSQLAALQDGDPLIIVGRKGSSPGTATIVHGPAPQVRVDVQGTITGRVTSGSMTSTAIGPAKRWSRFHLRMGEKESSDGFSFSVLGIKQDGTVDTLFSDLQTDAALSGIDAATYPYLKIAITSQDEINLTAAQLRKWLVLYEPVAEGLTFFQYPEGTQTIAEGQPFDAGFGFINISDKHFTDSLEVTYAMVSPGNHSNPLTTRILAPAPGDTTHFTVRFATASRRGIHDIEVMVNPRLEPEMVYENNVLILRDKIDVLGDVARPVLEVTFDGRFLENEDYVSKNPEIAIRIWDENRYMPRSDTLGMRVFLAYPCGEDAEESCAFQRVYFSNPDVTVTSDEGASVFTVHFSPKDLPEGRYKLRVEAADVAGNVSGDTPYEIIFRVAGDDAETVLSQYPNPFFTEVNFTITITGEKVLPSVCTLLITDVNGKEVARWKVEDLRVGKNILRWNGTGPDGNFLPGGLYLYRMVIVSDDAEREYSGRVVLMR